MSNFFAQRQTGLTSLLIILLVAVMAGVFYLGSRPLTPKPVSQTPGQKSATTGAKPISKAPGIITQVLTAKGIDLKTGEAVNPTSQFSKTDKSVYLVLTLKNPKVGTKFEYVRYLNGKFLDNGNLTSTKAITNNVSFSWTLKKPGATHLVGNYRVKVYTNGAFEKEISYIIQ